MDQEKFSVKRRLMSFSFAKKGIINLFRNEHNARVHLVSGILIVILGFVLSINRMEWVGLILVIGLVILTELFNTAIERLADKVDRNWCDEIGLVKDYSAGAVLISVITALIVGGLIFVPRIISII